MPWFASGLSRRGFKVEVPSIVTTKTSLNLLKLKPPLTFFWVLQFGGGSDQDGSERSPRNQHALADPKDIDIPQAKGPEGPDLANLTAVAGKNDPTILSRCFLPLAKTLKPPHIWKLAQITVPKW